MQCMKGSFSINDNFLFVSVKLSTSIDVVCEFRHMHMHVHVHVIVYNSPRFAKICLISRHQQLMLHICSANIQCMYW